MTRIESAPSLTVGQGNEEWQGFAEDWSQEARDQQLRDLRARGHGELADHYEQGDQVRADLARDRDDLRWKNPDGTPVEVMYAKPETEAQVESPKRKGILRRLSAGLTRRLVSKPGQVSQEPFDRDQNGW